MSTPQEITSLLGLEQLPIEGGLFTQSWRSGTVSAIYYLLSAPEFSAVHRLDRTEIFTYHAGAPARMLLLSPDGSARFAVLGTDLAAGQRPQVVVPPGTWQAAETLGEWTLMGCVVVPPYVDDCVEFGRASDLAAEFPLHADEIRRLCRE
ncbi:MAG: cupin domain-containing protein [Actinophytocola sp.]|uniref:cupin domain-containing protein n=1 Tax=Actinophytocola sp. TaxID=1872138 RepID=UPI003C71A6C5